jgi:hypothetical protein
MSTHDNIAFCMMLLDDDLVVRLVGEELLSLYEEMLLGRDAGDGVLNRGGHDWERAVGACSTGHGAGGFTTICTM